MKVPTARKLPSGSWFVRVQVNGKRVSVTESTEKKAIATAMALKANIKKVASAPKSDQRLKDAVGDWIEKNDGRLSPSTIRGYRIIQRNSFPSLMQQKCGDITESMVETAVNSECKKFSAKTVINRWRFLQQVLSDLGYEFHPKLTQVVTPDIKFLDRAEISKLLVSIQGTKEEIPCLLALSSLRRSEIAALTWEHVDLDNRWIHVRGAMVPDQHNKMILKETNKNEASRRDVPIIAPLYEALQAVPCKIGRVVNLHPATIQIWIDRACAIAEVPQVGCHGLRHSFASLCHILNIPPAVAMEIGGWSDRATMDNIYTHVSKREKNSFINEFTNYFENGNKNGND